MAIIDEISVYQNWTEDGYKFKKLQSGGVVEINVDWSNEIVVDGKKLVEVKVDPNIRTVFDPTGELYHKHRDDPDWSLIYIVFLKVGQVLFPPLYDMVLGKDSEHIEITTARPYGRQISIFRKEKYQEPPNYETERKAW